MSRADEIYNYALETFTRPAFDAVKELKDIADTKSESVVYYRNLAIRLGAQPEHMLNEFDKGLCEQAGMDVFSNDDGSTNLGKERSGEVQTSWDLVAELRSQFSGFEDLLEALVSGTPCYYDDPAKGCQEHLYFYYLEDDQICPQQELKNLIETLKHAETR